MNYCRECRRELAREAGCCGWALLGAVAVVLFVLWCQS